MTKQMDYLKILDDIEEIRQKAAENPKSYSVDYVVRVCAAFVAREAGIESRSAWTDELKKDVNTKYSKRYYGECGRFHL